MSDDFLKELFINEAEKAIDARTSLYEAGYEKGKAEVGGGGVDWSQYTDFRYFSVYNNRNDLIPQLNYENTSNGTDFSNMYFRCDDLETFPIINTSNGTSFNSMFYECALLTKPPAMDTSNGTNFNGMFYSCKQLTEIPAIDTSNGKNFMNMFGNCTNLITIPEIDMSNCEGNGTLFNNIFGYCTALTNVSFKGTFKVVKDLSVFSHSSKLTVESLVSFLNALSDNSGLSTTYKVTIGSTNLRKLSDEQKQIAFDKNITLV